MAKLFIAAAVAYLLTTLLVASSALALTLWAHQTGSEPLQDLVSASILHTAAACAAMGFVGGFDMFFTIWQLMRNNQLEDERRKEREEDRKLRAEERQALGEDLKAREEERKTRAEERAAERKAREEERQAEIMAREEERQAREEERAMTRRIQEEILAQLQAERVYRDEMTARVMELTYQLAGRDNGGSATPTDRE